MALRIETSISPGLREEVLKFLEDRHSSRFSNDVEYLYQVVSTGVGNFEIHNVGRGEWSSLIIRVAVASFTPDGLVRFERVTSGISQLIRHPQH